MKTNTLLLGPIGAGKSYSIRTLLPRYWDMNGQVHVGAGREVFLTALEPGSDATLGAFSCEMGLHIHQHLPATVDWDTMEEWVRRLGIMSMEDVAKMNVPPQIRQGFQQFLQLYHICADWTCDRCEKSFGLVDEWDDSRALVFDGLTGLSTMASQYVVGPKPIRSLPQTGAAQDLIYQFLCKVVSLKCSVVLISHWSREQDETQGGSSITVDTIGVKLAPKILKIFDEIVVARRDGTKFSWSTLEPRVELKVRRLPYADNLAPDFRQIFGEGAELRSAIE